MELTFEAYGEKLVSRKLERFADRADDATPAWKQIADQMMGMEDRRFQFQGYGQWPRLADSTIAQKAREGLDPRILHATLDLRNSLTKRGDENQLLIEEPSWMVFGTHVPYARYHQKGEGVPRRRPLQFGEDQKRRLVKTLQRFMVTGIPV